MAYLSKSLPNEIRVNNQYYCNLSAMKQSEAKKFSGSPQALQTRQK